MTRERYLSDDELARLMAAVRSRRHVHQPRDYAFFALLANTGIRPSEARALRARDIGARGRWIRVKREKRNGPHPTTSLPLARPVAAIVQEYVNTLTERDALLFPFTKRQSGRLFHYYGARAQIPQTLRLYSLRHTCGMRLWRHTGDLRLIQAIMGHSRLQASRSYEHILPGRLAEMYAALGALA
jgi:integrase